MKRTKLRERCLPDYTKGEELMNMVTHIAGGAMGIVGAVLCLLRSDGALEAVSALVYGVSLVGVYAVSSVYHGLKPGIGKKVMQVVDHCTIYFLIAGTYTPVAAVALSRDYPAIGWGLVIFQWALAALAVTLTAVDLKKYRVFSMVCYIGMGWAVLPFLTQTRQVLGDEGFGWLLAGGIAYTIGAILYGIGSKKRWFHSVFHVFVVLGSLLQMLCVIFYVM